MDWVKFSSHNIFYTLSCIWNKSMFHSRSFVSTMRMLPATFHRYYQPVFDHLGFRCGNLFILSCNMIVGISFVSSPSKAFPLILFLCVSVLLSLWMRAESGTISFHDFLFHLISYILWYWNRNAFVSSRLKWSICWFLQRAYMKCQRE